MGRRSPNSDKIATHAEMRDLIASTPSDDPTWFAFGDTILAPDTVTDMLAQHLSQARRAAIEGALHKRTENVTVVLEGLVDYGNVSAVMRTAEGFGIQRVHAVDTADKYKRSKRTTQGADKWIDRYRWDAIGRCLDSLADDGYRIVAADVSGTARPIWDVDLTDRCAIVLGNELEGLTPETKRRADIAVTIPMEGFTESFNISVAASLVLYEVMAQRRSRFGSSGDLPAEVRSRIRAVWYSKSVSNARAVIEHKLASVTQ